MNPITQKLQETYNLLSTSPDEKAEEVLGHVAEAKALWEGDSGSFSEEDSQCEKADPLVSLPEKTAKDILKLLQVLRACPPTVKQVINAGDDAIDAAGLNPWCLNEGLAQGDESISLRELRSCIEGLTDAVKTPWY